MVAIARVLLNANRLLLVDEPTKGLAPKVVTEVADVLERVARDGAVLLVEQNLAVVAAARRATPWCSPAGAVVPRAGPRDGAAGRPASCAAPLLGVGSAAGAAA